jgi:hypothetical protein
LIQSTKTLNQCAKAVPDRSESNSSGSLQDNSPVRLAAECSRMRRLLQACRLCFRMTGIRLSMPRMTSNRLKSSRFTGAPSVVLTATIVPHPHRPPHSTFFPSGCIAASAHMLYALTYLAPYQTEPPNYTVPHIVFLIYFRALPTISNSLIFDELCRLEYFEGRSA